MALAHPASNTVEPGRKSIGGIPILSPMRQHILDVLRRLLRAKTLKRSCRLDLRAFLALFFCVLASSRLKGLKLLALSAPLQQWGCHISRAADQTLSDPGRSSTTSAFRSKGLGRGFKGSRESALPTCECVRKVSPRPGKERSAISQPR